VPEELAQRLAVIAAAERRSVHMQMLVMLEQAAGEYEGKNGTGRSGDGQQP
jgi:hypothetical protein